MALTDGIMYCAGLQMQRNVLLLSLKPKFAAAMYDGHKKIEFRRVAPRCALPIDALIYETTPIKMITGIVTVRAIVSGSTVARLLALAAWDDPLLPDYARYLAGARRPCALLLQNARRHKAIALSAAVGMLRPPQSYCYVSADCLLYDL
jgi:predicted transcriptional regulator